MAFNSLTYLILLGVVIVLYYRLPQRFRWVLLLVASYIFYMAWKPALIVLIVFSTASNFLLARKIDQSRSRQQRKRLLLTSLFINFGLLFVFKYLVFFNNTFRWLAGGHWPIPAFDLILPMGISFYTFQAAAYTIDVYRGRIRAERHYGIFSLFITFFPQLVAGPIERSENLLPQFYERHKFSADNLLSGGKILLWGFFKKVVIADRAAVLVNTVYNHIGDFGGPAIALATLLFAFQIYCDFSGYSDIAQGSARCLGFRLMDNFQKPYLSTSIREFWRRWHISLSGWFADYVYIPLGGNRGGKARQCRNQLITFLVSGLWHGANWTFVLWGALHGLYQVVGTLTRPLRTRMKQARGWGQSRLLACGGWLLTFGLVTLAWVFFRANTIADAFTAYQGLAHGWHLLLHRQSAYEILLSLGLNLWEMLLLGVCLLILVINEALSRRQTVFGFWEERPWLPRVLFYAAIAILILLGGVFYDATAFIYFQF